MIGERRLHIPNNTNIFGSHTILDQHTFFFKKSSWISRTHTHCSSQITKTHQHMNSPIKPQVSFTNNNHHHQSINKSVSDSSSTIQTNNFKFKDNVNRTNMWIRIHHKPNLQIWASNTITRLNQQDSKPNVSESWRNKKKKEQSKPESAQASSDPKPEKEEVNFASFFLNHRSTDFEFLFRVFKTGFVFVVEKDI